MGKTNPQARLDRIEKLHQDNLEKAKKLDQIEQWIHEIADEKGIKLNYN